MNLSDKPQQKSDYRLEMIDDEILLGFRLTIIREGGMDSVGWLILRYTR